MKHRNVLAHPKDVRNPLEKWSMSSRNVLDASQMCNETLAFISIFVCERDSGTHPMCRTSTTLTKTPQASLEMLLKCYSLRGTLKHFKCHFLTFQCEKDPLWAALEGRILPHPLVAFYLRIC